MTRFVLSGHFPRFSKVAGRIVIVVVLHSPYHLHHLKVDSLELRAAKLDKQLTDGKPETFQDLYNAGWRESFDGLINEG